MPTDDEVLDFIVTQYRIMMQQYLRDRDCIPSGNLIEVAFEDLEKDALVSKEVRACVRE